MIVLYNLFLMSLAIIQNGILAEFVNTSSNILWNAFALGLVIGVPFWYISYKFRYEIMKDTEYFIPKCLLLYAVYHTIFGLGFGNL